MGLGIPALQLLLGRFRPWKVQLRQGLAQREQLDAVGAQVQGDGMAPGFQQEVQHVLACPFRPLVAVQE